MRLGGKRALVTGGGRGIGAAISRQLAALGAEVVVAGRNLEVLESHALEIGATALACDLSSRTQTDELLAQAGEIDILVNNAGIAKSAPVTKVGDDDWDRIMEVNATAPFRLCRGVVPSMVAKGWGRIVNIASNAGLTGYRYSAAYCASKHALIGLTRSLATDLAPTGVTVNAVCPGWVETDMAKEAVERIAAKTGAPEGEARGALEKMSPQGRWALPSEVAHLVVTLTFEESRGIHGQALVIDGGQVMK